ncbi:MAG: hypothetical protein QG640_676 [Patescibacteria group bacterium]|nr:hypothetical protein [Patescibacteria group bacterium]
MKTNYKLKDGFVALTLVITVSSLLLAFTFMQSIEIGHFFDMTQRKQYRLMNHYNAYNCIDQAILALANDYFYQISEPYEIPDLYCVIDSVEENEGLKIIYSHGNFKNGNVKRLAVVRLYDNRFEIISID